MILIFSCFLKSQGMKYIFFNLLILTTSLELFVEVGFFIKIANFDINYRTISEVILFFVSILILGKNPIRKNKIFIYAVGLLIILFAGLLLLVIFPTDISVANIDNPWEGILVAGRSMSKPQLSFFVFQQCFQMVIYITILFVIYLSFHSQDYFRLIDKFANIVKFFLILGVLEFISKYIFHWIDYGEAIKYLFGYADSTVVLARTRGYGIELQGFTKEASHYSYTLFISIVILLSQKNNSKSNHYQDIWILAGIMLMIFCMSFSSVLFGIAFISIYVLTHWNITQSKFFRIVKQGLFVIAIVIGIIIIINSINLLSTDSFFSRRVLSLFEEFDIISSGSWQHATTALEWSNRVRLLGIFMTIKAFLYRPLLGYGFGTITCHGSTAMMLSGVGLVGVYYWVELNFAVNKILTSNINRMYFNCSIMLFLFVNLFNSLGLRPFYEMHSFLFAISISLIFIKKNSKC